MYTFVHVSVHPRILPIKNQQLLGELRALGKLFEAELEPTSDKYREAVDQSSVLNNSIVARSLIRET